MLGNLGLSVLQKEIINTNEKTVGRIVEVDINKITKNENNFYDDTYAIEELKKSIKLNGQIEPVQVDRDYKIISGHRRYTAIKDLGHKTLKVIVINIENEEDGVIKLIEANRQRVKTPEEIQKEILILKEFYDKKRKDGGEIKGKTTELIAESLNISDSTVKRHLRKLREEKKQISKKTPLDETEKFKNALEKALKIIENSSVPIDIEIEEIKVLKKVLQKNIK